MVGFEVEGLTWRRRECALMRKLQLIRKFDLEECVLIRKFQLIRRFDLEEICY